MQMTNSQREKYYKNSKKIDIWIVEFLKKHPQLVVYGARSVNAYVSKFKLSYLKKHTEDWDVYAVDYNKMDRELERYLDKKLGGNYFSSNPAKHAGTQKVRSNVTGNEVADFTKPERKISYSRIGGISYASPIERKRDIRKSLKDPNSAFRRNKDLDARSRLSILDKKTGKKLYKGIKHIFG